MFSGFSTCSVFSPLALHIWHTISWTVATLNASGSATYGTEILAKYFPLSQAEHTCAASSDLLMLGRLKIFNLCYFYQLACLSTDVTKASMLSCSLSTHEPKISISCFVFVACSLLSHTSFPSSHFIRHRSVEAYYASGWNSRTWAVNENFIGVCEFDIFRKCAKNACLCWFSKWKIHLNLSAVIAFL